MKLFTTIVFIWISALSLFAEQFPVTTFTDQFGKKSELTNDTHYLIIVFTKDHGKEADEFFVNHPDFLKENHAMFLSELSGVPSIIMKIFMNPKFKRADYPIYIIKDEKEAKLLPKQEDMITVVNLNNREIEKISYIKSMTDFK